MRPSPFHWTPYRNHRAQWLIAGVTSLLLALALGAVPPAAPATAAAQITATPAPYQPRFVPGPCPVDFPDYLQVTCGHLIVPEDRQAAEPRLIKVAVGIGKASGGARQPDPVFYLHGGPGLGVLGRTRWWPLSPFRVDRDVIVMDQRGSGFSEPALTCPEMADIPFRTLAEDTLMADASAYHVQQAQACAARLSKLPADLRFYTNREVAQDLEDLRVALGYGPIDLFAWSAGTRAALTMLRMYPRSVRAAILDSVFMPPGIDYYAELAPNAQKTFIALFAVCAATPACSRAYPDLPVTFARTVERLQSAPARFTVKDPVTGQFAMAAMNGRGFVGLLYRLMYESYRLGSIPAIIAAVHDGDYSALPDLMAAPLAEPEQYAVAMNHAIHCTESAPFTSAGTIESAWSTADAHYLGYYHWDIDPAAFMALCPLWPTRPKDVIDQTPVVSDVPTLIFSGALDPASPPQHAAFAAQTLTHSTLLTFPTLSHFVWEYGRDCPKQIALGFLNAPDRRPDDRCIAAGPAIVFDEPGAISTFDAAGERSPRRAAMFAALVAAAGVVIVTGAWLRRARRARLKGSRIKPASRFVKNEGLAGGVGMRERANNRTG
jgi:pimeloyl-ACP methyl ester carboxylesterase